MPKSTSFWLPAVRWARIESPASWPQDVILRCREILQILESGSTNPYWVCGGTTVGVLAADVRHTLGHWPQERQAQVLAAVIEVSARLALLEQSLWGWPDVDLAASSTARVIIHAYASGATDLHTAQWMQVVWGATLADQIHLSPEQVAVRRQAAASLLDMPDFPASPWAMAPGWEDIWADLGDVWCCRSLRRLTTAQLWDEAPVRAMQHLLTSYQARNHEELPLEDVVSISLSETCVPAGLAWNGWSQSQREVARRMVQATASEIGNPMEPGTERMVLHFAGVVTPGFEPRVRMAGSFFVQQIRWDAVASSIGLLAAMRWLLWGRTPWTRGYGWRELLRALSLQRSLRWPLLAGLLWTIFGRLGPGGSARHGWLISQFSERSQPWDPPARVELRSRSGVAWAAES